MYASQLAQLRGKKSHLASETNVYIPIFKILKSAAITHNSNAVQCTIIKHSEKAWLCRDKMLDSKHASSMVQHDVI